MNNSHGMAFDKASVRRIDQDGRMHVEISNISKAAVNPYYGREIPDFEKLGLAPNQIYMLLRDPAELEKAAATFNNIPILSKHIPATADAPQKEFIVGSTGTDAQFSAPYLQNSLVFWDSQAIAGIETEVSRELSSAYRYDADMTPGEFEGTPYDGVMRNIRGNHVACVETGRAGPDVYVFDSQPTEHSTMKRSQIAVAITAALGAMLTPKLAQDAQLGNLAGLLPNDLNRKNLGDKKVGIIATIKAKTKGKLAQDIELQADELSSLIDGAAASVPTTEDNPAATDDGDDACAQVLAMLKNLSPEDQAKIKQALNGATDTPPPDPKADDDKGVPKAAMDAAISKARTDAESAAVARLNAIRVAENEVRPIIGEVIAQDSAEAVYKMALDHAKVDLTDVPPSAYRALVTMTVKAKSEKKPGVNLAQDSARGASSFNQMFPEAATPGRI